ncbi:uncharacterized protein RJT21DRAFT_44381 [Scheffersomyces amazonensis]|uniref:uncharacterized protein n=1 Tax=Scheffersomyces amazonensis TaxID=1078765 RepID=UPI00315DEF6E
MSIFFCCSVEDSESSDDKSQSPNPRHDSSTTNRKGMTANNINPSSSNTKGNSSSSKDTKTSKTSTSHVGTTSTHHKSKQTPEIVATALSSSNNDGNIIQKKDLLDDDNSVNETDTITNTGDEANNTPSSHHDKSSVTDQQQQGIITQVSSASDPNGKLSHSQQLVDEEDEDDEAIYGQEDDYDEEDESVLDLTELQDGQAFNPETGFLLGKKDKKFGNKKCLILDLDETLVHSSFKYLKTADFTIPVEIENQVHYVYVIKRPGVDEFLKKVGQWFEVVVFTASVSKYGDPLLNKLDIHNSVHHRLFRDSCYSYQGNFIKNLSQIGRPLSDSIIIDNSPASYIFHPQHSIPISSWFSDTHDNELLDLLPFLEDISKSNVDDVSLVLDISL